MKKKLTVTLLTVIICLISNTFAFANTEKNAHYFLDSDQIVEPRFIPCNVGPGACKVSGRGYGNLYKKVNGDNVLVFRLGYIYQCSQCNRVILSQREPSNGLLGTYTIVDYGERVTNGLVLIVSPEQVDYNSSIKDDPYLSSCEWDFGTRSIEYP